MATIRQMPELYLRGSVANVTMAHLTKEQQQHLASLLEFVAGHPEMAGHKSRVMREFGVTIRGDYQHDRMTAEAEYNIAVWRGLVDLFYHRHYTFSCEHCKSSSYTTERGREKTFDRVTVPCPNCRHAVIDNPGHTSYKHGDVVNYDLVKDTTYSNETNPTFTSCMNFISGEKKYSDPEKIIQSPEQLRKFFGEFVWNYFRQQINENERKYRTTTQEITAPADQVIAQEIVSLCSKMEVEINSKNDVRPDNGFYSVKVFGLLTTPEFSCELLPVLEKAEKYGVVVRITPGSIDVQVHNCAPVISSSVIRPEYISMIDGVKTESGDDEQFSVEQISFRTSRGSRMDQEDHVATIDLSDASRRTRSSLPENCQAVYDIFCQTGGIYEQFSTKFGDQPPKINHIAEFLGITAKVVKNRCNTIKLHCLANDFVPS